jgi:uncharacterized membrane protein YhaH (DUF805 family)
MLEFWFSPYGRAARADYWYWLMVPALIGAAVLVFMGPIILGPQVASILLLIGFTIFFFSHMAMAIKRLHDQSLSGWYGLALVVPFAVAGALLASPEPLIDIHALDNAPDELRLIAIAVFAAVFTPFATVLWRIWFVIGKDGVNRYGKDPLYR